MEPPILSLFDYYTAFLSVVLGLAVADMATSLHRLLLNRRVVRFRVIPLLGALAVFSLVLAHFLRLWNGGVPMSEVSFYQLVFGTAYVLILFLLAASSLPDSVQSEGLDMEDWYFGNRGYLFGLACVLQLWDGGREAWHIVTAHVLSGEAAPVPELLVFARFAGAAVFCAALARYGGRVWHFVGLLILLVTIHFGFSTWTLRYPEPPPAEAGASGAPAPAGPPPRRAPASNAGV